MSILMSHFSQAGLVSPQADKALWSACLREISARPLQVEAKANILKESRGLSLWLSLVLFSAFFLFVGIRTGDFSALFWFFLGGTLSGMACARHYFYERYIRSARIAKIWFRSRLMVLTISVDGSQVSPGTGFRKTFFDSKALVVSQQFLRRLFIHPSSRSFSITH